MKSEIIKLYEGRNDVSLTTYVLQDSPEMLNGKTRPGILICPGGAYMSCTDREGEPIALKFASMGYHAFVLRYSTYGEGKSGLPDLSKPLPLKAHCQYPNPMREIGKSMLILHEHAADWHLDTKRIAVCGFSAGAHNVAMYATNWHTDTISEYFREDKDKFRPAAAILGYMLSDYVYMKEASAAGNPMDAVFFAASNTAFLGTPNPSDELLRKASPARNVTEHMPATFLWATATDEQVPVQHSIRMAHALADHKIPFEMHIFEEGPHALALADQASAEAKSQIYPDAAKWADLAGCWLQKRFALPLPEKSSFELMLEKGL